MVSLTKVIAESHCKISFSFTHSNAQEIISEDEEESVNDNKEKQETSQKGPPKRKLIMEEYPSFMAKRFADFQPYRDSTLQKWYDKTRFTTGKTNKVTKTQILNISLIKRYFSCLSNLLSFALFLSTGLWSV